MLKRKNISAILFVCLAAAFLMTACMNSAGNDENANATVSPGASPAPTGSQTPVVTPSMTSSYDWVANGRQVEDRLNKLSEISESRVLVEGNTALVGVRFTPAYQGELTSRIRQMIAGEIMAADPSIKTVAVTTEEEDVTRIYELSDRVRAGEQVDTLEKDIDEIVRNATTLS